MTDYVNKPHVDYCDWCGMEFRDIDVGFCLTTQHIAHYCGGSFKKRLIDE